MTKKVVADEPVNLAMVTPPQDTRARARSSVMRSLTNHKARYVIEWDSIYVEDEKYLNLDDPFQTYDLEVQEFVREFQRPDPA
jgi:hypothetical protein